ncbi:MAG: hypothetical protein IPP94_02725, partial [Ignavibacteria bacterium]|nr:hypothetical protein [Ignavibacteria bacterium]
MNESDEQGVISGRRVHSRRVLIWMSVAPVLTGFARIVGGLCCITILGNGCSTTITISSSDPAADWNITESREYLRTGPASIAFADGTERDASDVWVSKDSVWFSDSTMGKTTSVPAPLVRKIVYTDRWKGALEGAGIGAIVAGVAGGAAAYAYESKRASRPGMTWGTGDNAPLAAIGGFIVGGLGGLLSGAIIGAILGHRTVF